jgi:thioredoxin 1
MEVLKHGSDSYKEILEARERIRKEEMVLRDNPEGIIMLGDSNFKEAVNKYPHLVVDCWADWCAPCRIMEPVIKELANRYKGRVVYGKLNVDENPGISAEYKITSIPTLLIFNNGLIHSSLLGAQPMQVIEDEVGKALKLIVT